MNGKFKVLVRESIEGKDVKNIGLVPEEYLESEEDDEATNSVPQETSDITDNQENVHSSKKMMT